MVSKANHNDSIMVIDDTAENIRLLETLLSEQGYLVRPFANGSLALSSAKALPPDLVLLDINMPEMDGYEVCRHFKKEQTLKDIPIIFLSALTETFDKVKAFRTGGVDYITKPFQMEEVQARIENHLNLSRYPVKLAQQNTKLHETLRRLESTQSQLVQSEKMASLGILTAGIAHEINNPINFIKSSVLGLKADMKDLLAYVEMCDTFRNDGG